MARYSDFLGRRVEVHYRAGDIILPASGALVADSGRSIFLEQNCLQRGQTRHFRWEIPYQYIVRLEEKPEPVTQLQIPSAPAPISPDASLQGSRANGQRRDTESPSPSTSGDGGSSLLPIPRRPKTA
jgi:hypothetical protein